jgi:hypothetical protein
MFPGPEDADRRYCPALCSVISIERRETEADRNTKGKQKVQFFFLFETRSTMYPKVAWNSPCM